MVKTPIDSADTCDAYFKQLIDLVPSQFYFNHQDQNKLKRNSVKTYLADSKLKKGRVGRFGRINVNPNDMAKYDPSAQLTSGLQQKLASLVDNAIKDVSVKDSRHIQTETYRNTTAKHQHGETKVPKLHANNEPREELRKKLEEFRQKRMNTLSPADYYDKVQNRRKALKVKGKLHRKEKKKASSENQKLKTENKNRPRSASEKPSSDSKGTEQLVYSKFEFAGQKKKPKGKQIPKSQYKELYSRVTKENEELEELKKTDSAKAKALMEKKAWSKALDLSQGMKVRDDPVLIKKTIKRVETQKKKSAKKWEERLDAVDQRQKQKQEKRKNNIDSRKQDKKDRKIKAAKKRGRL